MKKCFLIFISLFYCLSSMSALKLPNGKEADVVKYEESNGKIVSAILRESISVDTKYGTFDVKPNRELCFYESGALKSFFCTKPVSINIYTITPENSSSKKKQKASFDLSSTDRSDNILYPDLPIELYENGNLKSGAFMKSSLLVAATETDKFNVYQPSQITFYENERVKSLILAKSLNGLDSIDNMAIANLSPYLQGFFALATNKYGAKQMGTKLDFAPKTKLSFYPDGKVKEFTPVSKIPIDVLGDTLIYNKKSTPVTLSELGYVIAYTPDDNTIPKSNGKDMFYFQQDTSMEYFRSNGKNVDGFKLTLDTTRRNFTYGGVSFSGNMQTVTVQGDNPLKGKSQAITIAVDKEGYATGAEIHYDTGMEKCFLVKAGGLYYSATKIKCSKGKITAIELYNNLSLSLAGVGAFSFNKIFFAENGKTTVYLGEDVAKAKKVLISISSDKPSVTYDENLSSDSDIIFDDAGNAVSYTVKDKSSKEDKFITVNIK